MATNPFVRDLPPDANPFMAKPVQASASVQESAPPAEQPASVQASAPVDLPHGGPTAEPTEPAPTPTPAATPAPANDDELESPERASDEVLAYLVKETRKLKALADEAAERYAHARTQLWDASGHEVGELPLGAKFRAPSSRRSVDYKVLERKFPEAYEAVVRTTDADPSKPGSLVL